MRCIPSWFYLIIFLLFHHAAFAQTGAENLAIARQFVTSKDYDKALPIYEALYTRSPFDKSLYSEYLDALLSANQLDKALELTSKMQQVRRQDGAILVDQANVLFKQGQQKESEKLRQEIVKQTPYDQFQIKLTADALQRYDFVDDAIQLYQSARTNLNAPYLFANELAILYNRSGNKQGAIDVLLDITEMQTRDDDEVKKNILAIVESDKKVNSYFEKTIGKRLKDRPSERLTNLYVWYLTQNGDYASALKQVCALDRNAEAFGSNVIRFAQLAFQDEEYLIAIQAFDSVKALDKNGYYKEEISKNQLLIALHQAKEKKPVNKALAQQVQERMDAFILEYPNYAHSELILEKAYVQANLLGNVDTAIAILTQFIAQPNISKNLRANAKLQLGDYYILNNEVWESTLLYAQVDKEFKEDALGERAKFSNAKLAYYNGDFEWAQAQLKVLKAATSDLIANDALYLSVLIVENTPFDEDWTPLQMFAKADLLIYQNHIAAAQQTLDSILTRYPETPLQDDIWMQKANIAIAEGKNQEAIGYLELIYKNFKEDVLADDAVFKIAELYGLDPKTKQQSLDYYEKIILEYPSSSYVTLARKRYSSK